MTEKQTESKEQGSILKKALVAISVLGVLGVLALGGAVAVLFSQTVALSVGGVITEITGVNTVATSLADNVAELTESNNDLRKNNASLRNDNAGLKNENTQLLASNDRLTKINTRLNNNYGQLLGKIIQVQQVTNKVTRLVARLAAVNVSSMKAEAIPAIGTIVIASVTAYELYETCQIMESVSEINTLLDVDNATDDTITAETDTVCGYKVPTIDEIWETVKNSPVDSYNAVTQLEVDLPSLDSAKDQTKGFLDSTVNWGKLVWNWIKFW